MSITIPQAAALLDFLTSKGRETSERGIYYVSSASLNKLGILQWDLLKTPFHVSHEHLDGAPDVILHKIDKAKLDEFTHTPVGFLARIGIRKDRER